MTMRVLFSWAAELAPNDVLHGIVEVHAFPDDCGIFDLRRLLWSKKFNIEVSHGGHNMNGKIEGQDGCLPSMSEELHERIKLVAYAYYDGLMRRNDHCFWSLNDSGERERT